LKNNEGKEIGQGNPGEEVGASQGERRAEEDLSGRAKFLLHLTFGSGYN